MFTELLQTEIPRKGLKVREPELFSLVEKNFNEISAALEEGYSWKQIVKAFVKYYETEWNPYWGHSYIWRYYKRIKKEKQS